jgi:hypothetical protein
VLTTTAFAAADPAARARYRVGNDGPATKRVRLYVALRPFQVTPPWQAFQGLGGAASIRTLAWRDGAVEVDGGSRVVPLTTPAGFGAAAFEQGGALRYLVRGELPPRTEVADAFGHASGALCWDLELAPGAARDVHVAVPFAERLALGPVAGAQTHAASIRTLEEATQHWDRKLGCVRIRLAAGAAACIDTLRTATGHILVNRDGPALQPGPRRYTRSWIRDAATMSAALLRMGCADEVRDFLDWYAPHQAADGNVPCAVDRKGPDWLPEHDSHGQLLFTLAEYFRFTEDLAFAARLWPAALGGGQVFGGASRAPLRARVSHAREARLLRDPSGVGQPRGLSRAARPRLLGRLLGAPRPGRRGRTGARPRRGRRGRADRRAA